MKLSAKSTAIPKPIDTAPKDNKPIYVLRVEDNKPFLATWNSSGSSLIDGVLVSTGTWDADVGGWFEADEVLFWLNLDEVEVT